MISFLFSVVDKQVYWDKVYASLSQKYDKFEMIFAIHNQNTELEDLQKLANQNKNVRVFTFERDATENFMINQTIKHAHGDCLVLCRDYFVYATVLSDFLLEMGMQGAQIAMFQKQKKSNKITKWFSKLFHKTTKLLFGFDYYDGDIGLVYFGNIAFSVLKELPSCTLLTKVNRWKGFEICYATAEDINSTLSENEDKHKALANMICSLGVFVVLVSTLVVLCCFNLIGFLPILGFSMTILLNIVWMTYSIAKYCINRRVGNLK